MQLKSFGLLLTGLLATTYAQCPNQVAIYNPNARTQSFNGTFFLVPIPNAAAQAALDRQYGKSLTGTSKVQLVAVPSSDTSLFPNGYPAGMHPVLVYAGYADDIRMAAFQINGPLLNSLVLVPYVRRFDSKPSTVLSAQLSSYLVGVNNNAVAGLVPNVVATLIEGAPTRLGLFEPADAAYQLNGDDYSNKVAWNVLPNPISGPGIAVEAIDMQYVATSALAKTTPKLFKTVLNQPNIITGIIGALVGNICQRNQVYFNNATSTMLPRAGNVTLGSAADGTGPQAAGTLQKASPDGSGFFAGLEGFSACGQEVGFNPESCDEASQNVDPAAL